MPDDDLRSWWDHRPPPWFARACVEGLLIFFALYTAWWIGVRLRDLLVIILASMFVGFAMDPAVTWLARKGMRRSMAALLLYIALFVFAVVFVVAFGSLVVDQVVAIAKSLPDLLTSLADWLQQRFNIDLNNQLGKLNGSLTNVGTNVASFALRFGTSILSSIFTFFTIALFGYYFASQGPRIRRGLCTLLPQRQQSEVLRVMELATNKTGGYLYSRLLLALASATATSLFLYVVKVPNALTLGIFVGVVSQFVPTIGTYLAGALPVLVAFTISPGKALLVLVFIIGYQQFENYVLSPPLSSRTMEIHPAVAFGAVIAGAALIGPIGAFIALPVTATLQAFFGTYVRRNELIDSPMLHDLGRASEPPEAPASS